MTDNRFEASHELTVILQRFSEACPVPTPEQVGEWTSRHPDHAVDIEAFAAAAIVCELASRVAPTQEHAGSEAPRGYLERAFLRSRPPPRAKTLSELAEAAGLGTTQLTERSGMKRSVLAKLEAGLVVGPIPGRLPNLLANLLGVTTSTVQDAFAPRIDEAFAAASRTEHPALLRQTYEDALRSAGLSEEDVASWTVED